MKILGLNNSNLNKYLMAYSKKYESKFEILEFIDSSVKMSNNFILISLKGFPTELYGIKEFSNMMMTNKYDWFDITDKEFMITDLNIGNINKIFNENFKIKVYPMKFKDIELVNEYLINNNGEQITDKIVEYNKNRDNMKVRDRNASKLLISMADLGLIKELAVINKQVKGKEITYSYITVEIKNNRFIPIINILNTECLSPLNKEDRLDYNRYILTLKQVMDMLNYRKIVEVNLSNTQMLRDCNKEDIMRETLEYIMA